VLVLGIDPGTAATGYGVVRGGGAAVPVLVECGVIRTKPRDALATRLREIYEGVRELIERHQPDALSVEDIFYAKNVRTTVVLGHARGVLGVVSAMPRSVVHDRIDLRLPVQQVVRREPGRADDRDRLIHELGVRDDPLESLHAAHRDAHHGLQMVDAQHAREQCVLRLHHVANRELGEAHARLQWAIGRR